MKFSKACLSRVCSVLFCAALLATTGCGGSSIDDCNDSAATYLALFTDKTFVNERFAAATVRNTSTPVNDLTDAAVIDSLNNFSFDLHRAVSAENPDQGSIESGYSAALALLPAGAGGDTLASLNNLLGMDALVEDDMHKAINGLSLLIESRSNDDLLLHTPGWQSGLLVPIVLQAS